MRPRRGLPAPPGSSSPRPARSRDGLRFLPGGDALVRSRQDEDESYKPGDLDPAPRIEVATVGPLGGTYTMGGGAPSHYQAVQVPGPVQDTYGAGDCFAAGLTYGLAEGLSVADAIALAARIGASALTRRGAHGT